MHMHTLQMLVSSFQHQSVDRKACLSSIPSVQNVYFQGSALSYNALMGQPLSTEVHVPTKLQQMASLAFPHSIACCACTRHPPT